MLVGAAFAWMYAGTLKGLVLEWSASPDSSYGLVLAAAAAMLAWRRRAAFAAAVDRRGSFVLPVLALAAALLLYGVGQLGADVFLTRLSLIPVAAAIVWLFAGGRALRVMTAPFGFALMAIPLPALVVNAVTLPLQFIASGIAERSLMAVGLPVFRDGNLLELPSATLEVADACSGLRSLVSLIAIAVLIAWAIGGTRIRRALLIASAVPIAIVMNGWRIAATGVACELWDPRAASGGWHTFTGWLTFIACVAILVRLARMIDTRGADPVGRLESVHV